MLKTTQEKACRIYIGDREAVRSEEGGVPEHYRVHLRCTEAVAFRGIRHVGRETLVLVSRRGQTSVGVCPIRETAFAESELRALKQGEVFQPLKGRSLSRADSGKQKPKAAETSRKGRAGSQR